MLPLSKKTKQKLEEHENKLEDTGWVNLTLLENWQNYTSSQNLPQYCKKNGVVYMHGCIAPKAETTTSNRNVAQLPTECKPSGTRNNLYFPARLSDGTSIAIQITTAGMILGPVGITTSQWITIDGISFPI